MEEDCLLNELNEDDKKFFILVASGIVSSLISNNTLSVDKTSPEIAIKQALRYIISMAKEIRGPITEWINKSSD